MLANTSSDTVTVNSVNMSGAANDVTIVLIYAVNGQGNSASKQITVQKPSSLAIVANTDNTASESSCMAGSNPGCGTTRTFKYQVRDQLGQVMLVYNMQLWDSIVTTSTNTCNLGGYVTTCAPTNTGPCNVGTFADGTFNENLGICAPACHLVSGGCIIGCTTTADQTWNINGISLSGDVKHLSYQCDRVLVNNQ